MGRNPQTPNDRILDAVNVAKNLKMVALDKRKHIMTNQIENRKLRDQIQRIRIPVGDSPTNEINHKTYEFVLMVNEPIESSKAFSEVKYKVKVERPFQIIELWENGKLIRLYDLPIDRKREVKRYVRNKYLDDTYLERIHQLSDNKSFFIINEERMKELVNDYLELTNKVNQSKLDLQMITTLEDVFIEYQEYKDSINELNIPIPLTKFQQIKLKLLRLIKSFFKKPINKEYYV